MIWKCQLCSGFSFSVALSARPPCSPGLPATKPSGFYHGHVWHSLSCSSRSFPTADSVLGCLAGRVVHMIGDSTLRQWWEFLRDTVPCEWPRGERVGLLVKLWFSQHLKLK